MWCNGLLQIVTITARLTLADHSNSFAIGSTTVTWRATNSLGYSNSTEQIVIVEDTTSPMIAAVTNITVSVKNQNEIVQVGLSTPIATDLIDNAVQVTANIPANFAVGTTTITWTAVDSNGNTATATQLVTVIDLQYPQIQLGQAKIERDATGFFSYFTLDNLNVTITDNGSYTVTILNNNEPLPLLEDNWLQLESGSHQLTITATDNDNNTTTASLTVNISPDLLLIQSQRVYAGQTVTVPIYLSGEAVQYPVEVALIQSNSTVNAADHNAQSQYQIAMTQGQTQAFFQFNTANNIQSEDLSQLTFSVASATNADFVIGQNTVIEFATAPLQPKVAINLQQMGATTAVMVASIANATIVFSDSNNAVDTVNWELQSGNLGFIQQGFNVIIDQTAATGIYTFKATANYGNNLTVSFLYDLVVINNDSIINDSNANGIADNISQYNLPFYLLADNIQATDPKLVATELAQTLQYGTQTRQNSSLQNKAAIGAILNSEQLSEAMQSQINANNFTFVTAMQFSLLQLPYFGYNARVSIPINALTNDAQLMIWANNSWQLFQIDANNMISVATQASGSLQCPPIDSVEYTPLTTATIAANNPCLLLQIQDGNRNDSDEQANGQLQITAILVQTNPKIVEFNKINSPLVVTEVTATNNQHIEMLRLQALANSTDIALQSFSLSATGENSGISINTVSVWSLPQANTELSNATLIGSGQINASGQLNLSLTNPLQLVANQPSYMVITYQINFQ